MKNTFRNFNASPKDQYPAITFCIVEIFKPSRGIRTKPIFVEKRLKNYGLTVSNYWNIITGKMNTSSYRIEKLPDFSNVTLNLEEWMNSIDSNYLLKNLSLLGEIFRLSHQDAGQICYSMTSEFKEGQLKFMVIYDMNRLSKKNRF